MSANELPETAAVALNPKPRWRRGFWSLIVTQFQGAFSDNVLKNLVIFLIIGMGLPKEKRDALVPTVGALFALPFILFSMAGGYFADRFSKRTVTIGVKLFEVLIMFFALVALWSGQLWMQLCGVFLMGVHSAIFGPSKYGLLPELLPERYLSWGNGLLELGTFLAIITGTMAAGFLSDLFSGRQAWSGAILIALAFLGLATSVGITKVPAAAPAKRFQINFFADLVAQIKLIAKDRVLWLATLGNIYFFFIAALLQFNIVLYGKDLLGLSDSQNSYMQAAVAIGIGFGSYAAGYLSGGKIEYGLIPLGALGLSVFGTALSVPGLHSTSFAANVALLGFFGGFFIVPIAALLQHRPDRTQKGGVLAANNLLTMVGVFAASGVYYALATLLHLSAASIFLVSGLATLAATVYVLTLLPDALLRFVLWIVTHTIYRIRVDGRENIPAKGGALFVCNHLSMIDALLLLASTDRHIRFIIYKGMYEKPLIKPFARILRAIPISSELRPREMIHSLREASESIKRGEVVCIFAEGQITRIGHLLPFRRGFERIMKEVDAPIIPVALDGVWGSIFSFEHGRFFWKLPRRIPYPVAINYGRPLPPTAKPFEVRQAVQELVADAWQHRKARMRTLQRAFVWTARSHPFRFALAEARAPILSFGAALVRTIYFARRLAPIWKGQRMVGILLPPSVAGAVANFAALLLGKVPVNLNYTVSETTIASCIRQCEIQTVITSKAFLDHLKLKLPNELCLLEELMAKPTLQEKLTAFAAAWLMPVGLLERFLGAEKKAELDDLATVIFSSGSTGEPKGVMLTHYNVGSNIEQLDQTFSLKGNDRVLGVLPFFHSFGFTGTLCLPAVLGAGVVYHPNPLDAKGIGELVSQYSVTFLLATPTFLQLYMRGCSAEQFGSVQVVLVGAEKLPDRVAQAFEDHFGVRPLEAYGCTECAPAVTVNTRDFRAPGFRQVGAKRGKIGHPLPGMTVRIVDPETGQPVAIGLAGLLLVRGPNVMKGYLGKPDKTVEVLHDSWYTTGDVAALDEDGFLAITDRLSRFSKIGGEMVPHIKIEERLHELADITEQSFAVTGVPDEKKGERLVVLHTIAPEKLQACLEKLSQTDLPNLWKPRADQFFFTDKLPYLGTGKLDLRRIRELAMQFSAEAKS